MLKNYLLIALRTILKHKAFSAINLFGLAVGIACFVVIMLYVQDELAYDSFHADADRIYRVVKDFVNDDGSKVPDATTPPGLMPAMAREIPEIEQAVRIFPSWGYKPLLTYGEKTFYEERFLRVDSTFFEIFSFPFVRGEAKSAFAQPLSIVLTQSLAKKYFGDEDPMGKTLVFERRHPLQVSGILEDVPAQSHFKFDFLISIRSLSQDFQSGYQMDTIWGWYNFYTYIKIKPNTAIASVEPKIQKVFKANQPQNDNVFYTQPLAGLDGIHLTSHLKWELEPNSDNLYIYVFLTIALFVIFIAGINYVNLTTAKSALRAREVGLRKVVGAFRNSLVLQFLSESVLMAILAALAAIALSEVGLPFFNTITQKELSLFSSDSRAIWLLVAATTLVLGVTAGLYPAFYLSSFQPISVLKKLRTTGKSWFDLRKALVVFQFTLSVILIVGIIVIQKQMGFIQAVKLGFDKDQVAVIRNVGALPNRGEAVRAALAQITGVKNVASCDGMIGGQNWTNSLRMKGSNNSQLVNFLSVGYDFLETLGIELKEGRDFSPEFPADTNDAIILNETAVKQLGVPEPVLGQQIVWAEDQDTTYYAKVIGVVKDFHFTSLRLEIKPFAFVITPSRTWLFALKMSGQNLRQTLAQIESTWSSLVPGRPFDYYFLDESLDKLYRSEQNFRTVFSAMTLLSVIIACLGLFGLAAFTAEQRTKEIGIRKVLGATVSGVTVLLSKDFAKLVMIAYVIACPIAWYAMQKWLQGFAYRIDMGWWVFALAGGLALAIALFTVSTQAIKAALANPVDSLRYE
ncbi:ABC transporter permease [candidate division KSB1 bacterium]|nr:ABC transporter permease [candidate division KSB1 bacterium]